MKTRASNPQAAFSLIEVVLAIGVLAVAIIPLMALLPVGFSSYRAANDAMTQTAIARYISSSVGSKSPTNWLTNDIYFTDEMTALTNGTSNTPGAAYRVSFSISNSPGFNRENVPNDSAGTVTLNRLWRISYEMWDIRMNRSIGTNGFNVVDREGSAN